MGTVVVIVALALVAGALARFANWRPSLSNPFGTRSVDRSQPVLLQSVQDLSLYKAASGNFQLIIDLEKDASRDRGILDRIGAVFSDNPDSLRELYQLADKRIQDAAVSSGLVARAEQNTRAMLESMLHSLGYTKVTVTFTGPVPQR